MPGRALATQADVGQLRRSRSCVETWHAAESRRLHIELDRIGKFALARVTPAHA